MDFGCKGEELVEVKVKVVNTQKAKYITQSTLVLFYLGDQV